MNWRQPERGKWAMLKSAHIYDTVPENISGGICMRGRIYTDQKCPVCGGNFNHDDRRRGLFCSDHPDQMATGRFRVQFGRNTRRRFSVYREAERFFRYRLILDSGELAVTTTSSN